MVRNSPSAISSEMSRSTMFLPKCLATERMERSDAEIGGLLVATAGSDVVAMAVVFGCLHFADRSVRATQAATGWLLLHSRSRCTWRGVEHSARNKDASGNCPRRRGAGSL